MRNHMAAASQPDRGGRARSDTPAAAGRTLPRGVPILLFILGCLGAVVVPAATLQPLLEPVADIPLGGNATRLDYESLDPVRHLLFIAHLGDSAVIVFDTQTRRVIGA